MWSRRCRSWSSTACFSDKLGLFTFASSPHPCERPWGPDASLLVHREQRWGLNTYLYAPKDDYKHRMYWRDLYAPEEAGEAQQRPNTPRVRLEPSGNLLEDAAPTPGDTGAAGLVLPCRLVARSSLGK